MRNVIKTLLELGYKMLTEDGDFAMGALGFGFTVFAFECYRLLCLLG